LYCASQGGKIYKINPRKLTIEIEADYTGANGMWLTNDRCTLFVADITSTGTDAITVFDAKTLKKRCIFNSEVTFPHNLMLTADNRTLYVTHTTTGQVSVYFLTSYFVPNATKILNLRPGSMGIMRNPLDLSCYRVQGCKNSKC